MTCVSSVNVFVVDGSFATLGCKGQMMDFLLMHIIQAQPDLLERGGHANSHGQLMQ